MAASKVLIWITIALLFDSSWAEDRPGPVHGTNPDAAAPTALLPKLPKSTNVENAKSKATQILKDRGTFNPLRHKGDLAICVSAIGVAVAASKFIWELKRNRRARATQTPEAPALKTG